VPAKKGPRSRRPLRLAARHRATRRPSLPPQRASPDDVHLAPFRTRRRSQPTAPSVALGRQSDHLVPRELAPLLVLYEHAEQGHLSGASIPALRREPDSHRVARSALLVATCETAGRSAASTRPCRGLTVRKPRVAGRSFSRARFTSRRERRCRPRRPEAALLHPPGDGGVRRRVAVARAARPKRHSRASRPLTRGGETHEAASDGRSVLARLSGHSKRVRSAHCRSRGRAVVAHRRPRPRPRSSVPRASTRSGRTAASTISLARNLQAPSSLFGEERDLGPGHAGALLSCE
jgi:hypothetical protein